MLLRDILKETGHSFHWILEEPYLKKDGIHITLDSYIFKPGISIIEQSKSLQSYAQTKLSSTNKLFAYGGYGENRPIYQNSSLFIGEEPRSIHLGMDIWGIENLTILLPFNGKIHSFNDNNNSGDYGPTIITEHCIEDKTFYMLFGHLSRKSLKGLKEGKPFSKGQKIGQIGSIDENGNWPPHLHFQLISDIGNFKGDYPGVAKKSEADKWLNNCPDPNLIFNLES